VHPRLFLRVRRGLCASDPRQRRFAERGDCAAGLRRTDEEGHDRDLLVLSRLRDGLGSRQPGCLGEIPGFASPPRDEFALNDVLSVVVIGGAERRRKSDRAGWTKGHRGRRWSRARFYLDAHLRGARCVFARLGGCACDRASVVASGALAETCSGAPSIVPEHRSATSLSGPQTRLTNCCGGGGTADSMRSKRIVRKDVWVRIPPAAPCDQLIAGASLAIARRAGSGPVIRVHAAQHVCLGAAATGRPRPALLDLDVPALLKAAHRERDEEYLHRHDEKRQDAE
jgi:hypothetical protein